MTTPAIPPQPLMISIRRTDAMLILDLIDRIYINDKRAREGQPSYTALTPRTFNDLGDLYSRIDMELHPSWLDADLIKTVVDSQDNNEE